jgi:outer membrane protein OmpA-like peptidoglycan-associated protein
MAAPAAQPPPAVSPPPMPPRTMSVEETYRASLVQQTQLPSAAAAGAPGASDTLIISSEGLETVGRAPQPAKPATAARAPAAGTGPGILGPALKPAGSIGETAGPPMVNIATIQFADGSSRLDEEARRIIDQVARLYGEKGGKIRVVGHASLRTKPMDPERHARVNEGISIARANAVAGLLARRGVKRDAIVVAARGDSEPTYYEIMETGEAGNRRVEIYLETQP